MRQARHGDDTISEAVDVFDIFTQDCLVRSLVVDENQFAAPFTAVAAGEPAIVDAKRNVGCLLDRRPMLDDIAR